MAYANRKPKQKRLKPAGHSAFIESLIQPAIVVGSTMMSIIAAYVLGLDEITRLLMNRGKASDVVVVGLCIGMGFLIDMAIIVSATRYQMHAVRNDPREDRWLTLAKWVLGIGLASESMTLFYFFVHLDPQAFPPALIWVASFIHAVLSVTRAFLPPVVIAYFAAGVLPVMFDRADRNREIKSRTSSNIMLLIDKLSEVFDTDDKAEMLRALGGQLMLDTYATYDETARTSEDQQLHRDAKLLSHLARIHRLDWSAIAADVAPELATPKQQYALTTETTPRMPAVNPAQNGNGKLNNRAKREALAAALYGAHPTSPRDTEYTLDESDWASSDGRGFGADDFGEYNDDGPQFRMSQAVNAKRNRATPARVAPRGVEMVFDLPEGKTAKRSDTPEARKVMNYLDKHPGAQIKQISEATGISKPTVRRYASTWSERQDSAKRMAKLTEEMPAITADMLPEMSTVVIDESPVYEPVQ